MEKIDGWDNNNSINLTIPLKMMDGYAIITGRAKGSYKDSDVIQLIMDINQAQTLRNLLNRLVSSIDP